jgi:hypothetical protein
MAKEKAKTSGTMERAKYWVMMLLLAQKKGEEILSE